MFKFQEEAMFVQDREDLIGLLKMRFGSISSELIEAIYKINKLDTLERLFLVAANAQDINTFIEELQEGEGSFKILGERFNPLQHIQKKGDKNGEQNE